MIFVDTSAWYAFLVRSNPNHSAARQWMRSNRQSLLTIDYTADETLTLLRAHGHNHLALTFGHELFTRATFGRVHMVADSEFLAAWDIFQGYSDKGWSFTDCVSFAVMQRLKISAAFASDHHFRQFGFVQVVP